MSAAKLPRRKASSKAKTQIGYAGKTCLSNFWVKIGFSRTELGALHQVAQLFKQPKGRTTANATALVLTTALVHWERLKPLLFADRKSTRLNSSHRCISYAVFCLKKKNK